MVANRNDGKWLLMAGAGLVLLAGGFLWHDLEVPAEALVLAAALGAAVLSRARMPKGIEWLPPAAMLGVAVAGGLAYALTKSPMLIAGEAVALLGVVAALMRPASLLATKAERAAEALRWHGLVAALVAASWSAYFQFFTIGFAADDVARRLVPTVLWALVGVLFVLVAARRDRRPMRDAGFVLVALAAGKVLLYDTTHLEGLLRVAALAAVGALFLGGGFALSRRAPAATKEVA